MRYQILRYRPRTEGLFARIEQWVAISGDEVDAIHWRATTKENVTSIYGRTAQARIVALDKPRNIYEWLLEETFDAKGNHIRYEYAQEDAALGIDALSEQNRSYSNQRYIRRIFYGNTPEGVTGGIPHAGRQYLFEVFFDYGDRREQPGENYVAPSSGKERIPAGTPLRPDPFSTFRAGFELRTLRRCHRVLMFHHFPELGGTTLVRSTDFGYTSDPLHGSPCSRWRP